MSTHLSDCVGEMDLPPSTKLALMAFADSADKVTRVAYPDRSRVQKWACVSRSRCNEIVKDLTDQGLLVRRSAGRRGHTAEFYVLPYGCCALHGPVELEVLDPPPAQTKAAGAPIPNGQSSKDELAAGLDRPLCDSEGVDIPTANEELAAGPDRLLNDAQTELGAGIGAGIGAGLDRPPSVSTYLRNPSLRSGLPVRDAHPREHFDDFWAAYPRKVEKRASRTAWDRALKRGNNPAAIIAGAVRYRDDPNRVDQFTKHPPTWLNRDCWTDDPLPKRTDRKPTQTENTLGWLSVGRDPQPTQQRLRAIEGGR